MKTMMTFRKDKLQATVYENRRWMGQVAAADVSRRIRELLDCQPEVNMIFASAPSQNEFLEALAEDRTIPWGKIRAFHMDEYTGLERHAPQGFGNFIRRALWDRVGLKAVFTLDGQNPLQEEECRRYSALLQQYPADIVCLGIGENGHLAFNDPPVADFQDPLTVKRVELEEACRQQQVHDGCFGKPEEVPTHALTLTIPALMAGRSLFVIVPGKTKTQAVTQTLEGDISVRCPASILRTHPDARLYLDSDSAADILQQMQ